MSQPVIIVRDKYFTRSQREAKTNLPIHVHGIEESGHVSVLYELRLSVYKLVKPVCLFDEKS